MVENKEGNKMAQILKEAKQIGRTRQEELAELSARIDVLEQNLKRFKEYVKFHEDADENTQMGNGRCGYEAKQLQNQMNTIMEMAYRVDNRTFALNLLSGLKED